jgi:hypothetical protein
MVQEEAKQETSLKAGGTQIIWLAKMWNTFL